MVMVIWLYGYMAASHGGLMQAVDNGLIWE
jgi:hypothetical protein